MRSASYPVGEPFSGSLSRDQLVSPRTTAIRPLDLAYLAAKPLLFRLDAETVHDRVMAGLTFASRSSRLTGLISDGDDAPDPRLAVDLAGIPLSHPVGVAAGLDKNGVAVPAFSALGFGFVEVGTVTPLSQAGNDRPRVFRLTEDGGLINRMGFPGHGLDVVERNLRRLAATGTVVGCNVGPNKASVEAGRAGEDLATLSRRLSPLAAYLTVNVSSPNTARLRELQGARALRELLDEVAAAQPTDARRPILVKIAPDLSERELDGVVATARDAGIAGIVATNTTLDRPSSLRSRHRAETGGVSGRPLRERSLDVVRHLARRADGSLAIVAVGGIATGRDVVDAVAAGATAAQVYTAFIYRGPGLAGALRREMLDELNRRGVRSIAAVRGTAL